VLLQLDLRSQTPLHRQICDGVVALVESRALRPGDRLPPTRRMAQSLGVHRTTVVRAYDELRALGFIESTQGSYTTVRNRAWPIRASAGGTGSGSRSSSIEWPTAISRRARQVRDLEPSAAPSAARDGVIDFDRLAADPSLAPTDDFRACIRRVLAREGPKAFDYAEPAGWPPLRETVARRLRAHGIAVSPDEVLITAGAQQALDLVLRLLVSEGDRIAVEAPTYGAAHALFRLHGARPVEIPMRPDGMDLNALERCLERTRPRLVYTIPTFHNPTGTTTDQAHRERLLASCQRARTPLVEDGFEEEMKYFGRAVLPIKSMDANGTVLYVGTLSKVVFPGLRVGWVVAPRPAIQTLVPMMHAASLAVNTVAQIAAAHFCDGGDFDAYLRQIHRIYRRRMNCLLRGLDEHLPPEVEHTRPQGGYTAWLTLPKGARDEAEWRARLESSGVRAAPGSRFFAKGSERVHFRISIACATEEQIADGCSRLGQVLRRWLPAGGRRPAASRRGARAAASSTPPPARRR